LALRAMFGMVSLRVAAGDNPMMMRTIAFIIYHWETHWEANPRLKVKDW
jgi:hypothetical protein